MPAVMIGLVVVLFGVGAIESSVTDAEFFYACMTSAIGCMIMWAGVQFVKEQV
jgi:hypothetical protein